MLLVIPTIGISRGKCITRVQSAGGALWSDDPVEMARLWRKENAKSLHVTDVDGAVAGRPVNMQVIRQMVKSVDIPVALSGGLRTFEDVKRALEAGIYRAVIGTMMMDNPDDAQRTLEEFGPAKAVVGIDSRNSRVLIRGRTKDTGLQAVSLGIAARDLGFKRIIFTDVLATGTLTGTNHQALKLLAEATRLHITASGGVSGLEDLLKLGELERVGVDSVIIGRALYENKFSCQGLWRLCEAGNFPYTAKV